MDQQTPAPEPAPQTAPQTASQPAPTPALVPQHAPGQMPVYQTSYTPEEFNKLFMWWWILLAASIPGMFIFIGGPLMLASIVIGCILMYKYWNQLQDGSQKTTPGKAIGFMFIPFFNLYWQFIAIHGFAQNSNAYADRHGINMPRINENLTLTQCIIACFCIIPLVNILAGLALLVIGIINFIAFKNASVAIANHKLQHAQPAPAPAGAPV